VEISIKRTSRSTLILYERIYREKRIRPFEDIPNIINTAWDIGIGDSTAIWFYGVVGSETHVIDYYENSGESLSHYIDYLRVLPYNYGTHYGPHDIKNREFTSGVSRIEFAQRQHGFRFELVPNVSVDDGVDRSLVITNWFAKACPTVRYLSQVRASLEPAGCPKGPKDNRIAA